MSSRRREICTPEQLEVAADIIRDNLGPEFWIENGLPSNVGVKGDVGIDGDTLLIGTVDRVALKALVDSFDFVNSPNNKNDTLGAVSSEITNRTHATRVLLDLTVGRFTPDSQ